MKSRAAVRKQSPSTGSGQARAQITQPALDRRVLIAVLLLFGIGLAVRIAALTQPRVMPGGATVPTNRWHAAARNDLFENDEIVYATLVDQLDAGKGYTLRGSDILEKPWINREQYDRALFFHPPGGIVLFWATHLVTADGG